MLSEMTWLVELFRQGSPVAWLAGKWQEAERRENSLQGHLSQPNGMDAGLNGHSPIKPPAQYQADRQVAGMARLH